MKIAILGATSEIAKDLIRSFSSEQLHECVLFSRRSERMKEWQVEQGFAKPYAVQDIDAFNSGQPFDALINFVGVGNPALAASMGASILDVTALYDQKALDYLNDHPGCRYIFLSSGAVYGEDFAKPATALSHASFPVNKGQPTNWYSIAKFYAEMRHRAFPEMHIADIRVFNYVSRYQNINARFLITDIARAIHQSQLLKTASSNIIRDYICPSDFFRMISAVLDGDGLNAALDCYTKAPIDKYSLLDYMSQRFGLRYEVEDSEQHINVTGLKSNYYSTNYIASEYGYMPEKTALEGVLAEIGALLEAQRAVFPCDCKDL